MSLLCQQKAISEVFLVHELSIHLYSCPLFKYIFGLKIARHICMLGIFKDDKLVQLYYWICGSISNVKMTTVYCMLPSLSYK